MVETLNNTKQFAECKELDICDILGIETLAGANLDGLDLREADLRDVSFRGSSVAGVKWEGANLRGADLREAKGLDPEVLMFAELDHTTKLPEGVLEKMVPLAMKVLATNAPRHVYARLGEMFRSEVVGGKGRPKGNIIPFWPRPK